MAEPPADPKTPSLLAVITIVLVLAVAAGYVGLNVWAAWTAPAEVYRCDDGNTGAC